MAASKFLQNGANDGTDGTFRQVDYASITGTPGATVPFNYLGGLGLSYNSATVLNIAAGMAADSTNAVPINLGTFSKSTAGPWAPGSGSNGMGHGLTISGGFWHVILANNGGTPDIFIDVNPAGTHPPPGISDPKVRRIGSIGIDGSGNILPFTQNGDEFLWATPVSDVAVASLGTTAQLFTLTVPNAVKVNALLQVTCGASTTTTYIVTSPDTNDVAPSPLGMSAIGGTYSTAYFSIRTNTSQQIRARSNNAGGANFSVTTQGWVDLRGKT